MDITGLVNRLVPNKNGVFILHIFFNKTRVNAEHPSCKNIKWYAWPFLPEKILVVYRSLSLDIGVRNFCEYKTHRNLTEKRLFLKIKNVMLFRVRVV